MGRCKSSPHAPREVRGAPRGAWGLLSGALFALFCACGASSLAQTKVYEKPSDFIRGAFPRGVPAAQSVTLTSAMAKDVRAILGHDYIGGSRIAYWKSGGRTAWILEEIGKTQPITTGFVVDDGAIASVQVLVYRESHGWEVEKPFFTRQFKGARMAGGGKLDKRIDGIAGATLSVRALTRLSAMALYLHRAVAAP